MADFWTQFDKETQRKAREKYQGLIESLSDNPSDADLDSVATVILQANLQDILWSKAVKAFAKKAGVASAQIKTRLYAVTETLRKANPSKDSKARTDKKGRVIFLYNGDFNFDEAEDTVASAFLAKNVKDEQPTYCRVGETPARLSVKSGQVEFRFLTASGLWSEANTLVTFVRRSEQGNSSRDKVPEDVAKQVYERARTTFPEAPTVLYTPAYTEDGRLVLNHGWHEEINTLLVTDGLDDMPEVPMAPTLEDAQNSLTWIRAELLPDFKFAGVTLDGEKSGKPSEANTLAMIITPFMRRMIKGQVPLFLLDKPDAGAGATLLAWLIMWLVEGKQRPYIKYSKNPEEMEKKMVSAVKCGGTCQILDNVRELVDDTVLIFITSERVGGRELGSNNFIEVDNHFLFIATGKNPKVSEEMERRIVRIRLDAPTKPLYEREYRHPDISGLTYEQFVRKNRGVAVCHILTLIEYWLDQGGNLSSHKLPGFQDWAQKVGGVLGACGVTDFLNNKRPIATNTDGAEIVEFLRMFHHVYGIKQPQFESAVFERVEEDLPQILEGYNREDRRASFRDMLALCEGRKITLDKDVFVFNAMQAEDESVQYGMTEVPSDPSSTSADDVAESVGA